MINNIINYSSHNDNIVINYESDTLISTRQFEIDAWQIESTHSDDFSKFELENLGQNLLSSPPLPNQRWLVKQVLQIKEASKQTSFYLFHFDKLLKGKNWRIFFQFTHAVSQCKGSKWFFYCVANIPFCVCLLYVCVCVCVCVRVCVTLSSLQFQF